MRPIMATTGNIEVDIEYKILSIWPEERWKKGTDCKAT